MIEWSWTTTMRMRTMMMVASKRMMMMLMVVLRALGRVVIVFVVDFVLQRLVRNEVRLRQRGEELRPTTSWAEEYCSAASWDDRRGACARMMMVATLKDHVSSESA